MIGTISPPLPCLRLEQTKGLLSAPQLLLLLLLLLLRVLHGTKAASRGVKGSMLLG
eukprot:COSAG05_NODE_24469_length_251_cov_0.684211_2_plen_55_part_01